MDLKNLFIEELGDMLHAEGQILAAIPRLATATTSSAVRQALEQELEETRAQTERIERVFRSMSQPAQAKACPGMQGILAEGLQLTHEHSTGKDDFALDAALISCVQKAVHYRMASHGTLAAWAGALEERTAQRLLRANLRSDEETDLELSRIAENVINPQAVTSHDGHTSVRQPDDQRWPLDVDREPRRSMGSMGERVDWGYDDHLESQPSSRDEGERPGRDNEESESSPSRMASERGNRSMTRQ